MDTQKLKELQKEFDEGMKEAKTLGDYVNLFVRLGLIGDKLTPLMCLSCGCKEQEDINQSYLDGHALLEYDTVCANCGDLLGHWAYGGYEIQ